MASSQAFILIVVVVRLLISVSNAQAPNSLYHTCPDTGENYVVNTTFFTNLKVLLNSLSSNGSASGYLYDTVGGFPDRVNGLVLCRGDVDKSKCKTCLATASQDILDLCTFRKAATVWYDDCLLRYSNARFVSTYDASFRVYMRNSNNAPDWTRFNRSLVSLMDDLFKYAAYNTSAPGPRLFATGDIGFSKDFPKIYGLVQCTRDLSNDSCYACLNRIFGLMPLCTCNKKRGGRVIIASCNFRYEVFSFYEGSSRLSLPAIAATSPISPPPLHPPPPSNSHTLASSNTSNSTRSGNKKNATGTILAVIIPLVVVLILLVVFYACWIKRKKAIKEYNSADVQELPTIASLLIDFPTIRNATNNFSESNRLGEGGFGAVYKGALSDGTEIAVKRLSAGSGQGIQELRNEVVLLAKLQHRNLVKLLGVYLDEQEKLLIYEYVQNKSLDTILFDSTMKERLYWEKRYKIIRGIARGMLYLHEESQIKIIHRDLKASNILLDADLNPKISDFGLARLFGADQTQASTSRIVGTFGYMSSEYVMWGHFSNKSDVFSFGVLVLEIVTGRKNSDFPFEGSTNLLSYVWEHWSNGTVSDVVDPSLGMDYSQVEALRCIQIGLLCVQEAPADRPTMQTAVLMIDSYSISVHAPSRPAFLFGCGGNDTQSTIADRRGSSGGDDCQWVETRSPVEGGWQSDGGDKIISTVIFQ